MSDDLRAVSLPDAADRLGVTVKTLYAMEKRGALHISRIGRRSGIALYEIRRVLDAKKHVEGRVDVSLPPVENKVELFPKLNA